MKFALPTRVFVREENGFYNVYLDDKVQKSFIKEKATENHDPHLSAHFYAGDLAEEYDCMYTDEVEW